LIDTMFSARRAALWGFSQVRCFATEKQLRSRISATKNIAKITKSMKMVSASKLRGDTARLNSANPFQGWAETLTGKEKDLETLDVTDFPQKNLIIVLSTDKGLCGGVNSIMSRMVKQMLSKLDNGGKGYELMVMGEKGRAQLRSLYSSKFVNPITDRQAPYSFDMACCFAQDILQNDYDAIHIIYNEFKSAIKYVPSIKTIVPLLNPNDASINEYHVYPRKHQETLLNLLEYTLATQLFHSLLENAASEQSSRMGAMENATKNAGEMIDKLTLQYNRARQARITTELIEIISGASAISG